MIVFIDQDHLLAGGHVITVIAGIDALHDFKRSEGKSGRAREPNHQ